MKPGRPYEVTVELTPQDAVQILNSVVYGVPLTLNGARAHTADGRAVRITFERDAVGSWFEGHAAREEYHRSNMPNVPA